MRNPNGFSLIELLVALLIIGIIITITVLSFGDFGKSYDFRFQLERLGDNIELLQEKAILENSLYGIALNSKGYSSYYYDEKAGFKPLKRIKPIYFEKSLTLKTSLNNNIKPNILLSSTGLITPFKASVYIGSDKQSIAELIVEANGTLNIYPKQNL